MLKNAPLNSAFGSENKNDTQRKKLRDTRCPVISKNINTFEKPLVIVETAHYYLKNGKNAYELYLQVSPCL